jgi:hypothetical protein
MVMLTRPNVILHRNAVVAVMTHASTLVLKQKTPPGFAPVGALGRSGLIPANQ